MRFKGMDQPARFKVPKPDHAVIAAGQRLLAAGKEGHRIDCTIMLGEPVQQRRLAGVCDIPVHHGIVEGTAQRRVSGSGYGYRFYGSAVTGKVACSRFRLLLRGSRIHQAGGKEDNRKREPPPGGNPAVLSHAGCEPVQDHRQLPLQPPSPARSLGRLACLFQLAALFHLLDPQAVVLTRPVGVNLA